MEIFEIANFAKDIRRVSLQLAHNANSSHSGGALSMADILAVLYSDFMNISPELADSPKRDRFVLSKGHCCAALYATLALKKFFSLEDLLSNYGKDGTIYFSHVSHKIKGVEVSTGSLGHGLSISTGLAIGSRITKDNFDVYCLTGDGELDEGSCWEAIMFAAQHKLSNLCLIVDYNKIQSLGNVKDIIDLSSLRDKFKAFNWNTVELDGHNLEQIVDGFSRFKNEKERPTVLICNTIKGKGVSFMEDRLMWHYKSPNSEELKRALEELV